MIKEQTIMRYAADGHATPQHERSDTPFLDECKANYERRAAREEQEHLDLVRLRQDCIRMREALKLIASRLECAKWGTQLEDQFPHILQFAQDMAEGGKRPGFDEFIREKLDAAATG